MEVLSGILDYAQSMFQNDELALSQEGVKFWSLFLFSFFTVFIFSPSQSSNTPREGFEHAQNLSSGFAEWNCAVLITTTPWHHIGMISIAKRTWFWWVNSLHMIILFQSLWSKTNTSSVNIGIFSVIFLLTLMFLTVIFPSVMCVLFCSLSHFYLYSLCFTRRNLVEYIQQIFDLYKWVIFEKQRYCGTLQRKFLYQQVIHSL